MKRYFRWHDYCALLINTQPSYRVHLSKYSSQKSWWNTLFNPCKLAVFSVVNKSTCLVRSADCITVYQNYLANYKLLTGLPTTRLGLLKMKQWYPCGLPRSKKIFRALQYPSAPCFHMLALKVNSRSPSWSSYMVSH